MSFPRSYSPYGQHSNKGSQAIMLGFNGERYDPLSRTYALGQGYRSYSPALMRFQGPDDLSPFGQGGINAYAFCADDPVNYRDPTGHMRLKLVINNIVKLVSGYFRNPSTARAENGLPRGILKNPETAGVKKTLHFSNIPSRATYSKEAPLSKQEQFRYRIDLMKHFEREFAASEHLLNERAYLNEESTAFTFNRFTVNVTYEKRLDSLNEVKRRFDYLEREIRKTRS
ncbi:RHS repeat-associated core domain-containing protein [Pseudomonas sp. NPDC089392]|uniref:RHS repeat-associated core domain-containing protein n=1 Tax=Pseudomonas sp. NPDC089392 TaxID=3364459 RepID=UPI003812DFFF